MDANTASNVTWVLITAGIAGCTWIAKMILKPWSDAYLARSLAFVRHVEGLSPKIDEIVGEFRQQTALLQEITTESKIQTTALKEMADGLGSDPYEICKYGDAAAKMQEAMKERGIEVTLDECLRMLARERKRRDKKRVEADDAA